MHSVLSFSKKIITPHLEVCGNCSLKGEINVSGAKNSALVLMAASLLTQEEIVLKNVPALTDIFVMSDLLKSAGVKITRNSHEISLKSNTILSTELPYSLVHALRASFFCIGPLLAKTGEVKIPLPGGCRIGARPVDEHIKALKALGATVEITEDLVTAKINNSSKKLKGSRIRFNCRSVGATETILMAATLAEGKTILENAAQEPEVQDLANLLNKMGASIKGAGSSTIEIQGVSKLKGCNYEVIPDRIEAGTFLIAAAITGSTITVKPIIPEHLSSVLEKLQECGCSIETSVNSVKIVPNEIKAVDITTKPYPGFPTDLQAPFMALMAIAKGQSLITETVFEKRMQHVVELQRMGGCIDLKGNTALINGVNNLNGSYLSGGDLRSSAAMVLASLAASGSSKIEGLTHLDRGYENFEQKLREAGADITRIESSLEYQEKIANKHLSRTEVA